MPVGRMHSMPGTLLHAARRRPTGFLNHRGQTDSWKRFVDALIPIWLLASVGFRGTHSCDAQPQLGEAVTLFDWCVLVPMTFAICYRSMSRRALTLRLMALMCGGIWLAGKLVPAFAQNLLQSIGGMRWVGLSVLLLFEIAAPVAMLRVIFGATPDPRVREEQGIPPVIAKLMIAEARFWRWLWGVQPANEPLT